jgi:electron transfer flavoprotein beta subunit
MAEYLGIPHIANVIKIEEIKDVAMVVEMDMPSTIEVAEIKFPCLLTVEKDIYQPRLPSYRKKIATAGREIKMIGFKDLEDQNERRYGLMGSPTQVERIFPPAVNTDKEMWNGAGEELGDRLTAKLKELKFI